MFKWFVQGLCITAFSALGAGCVSDPTPHPAAPDVGSVYPGVPDDTDLPNGMNDEAGDASRCEPSDVADADAATDRADMVDDSQDPCGDGDASPADASEVGPEAAAHGIE